jgi:hypothetical protein
MALRKGAGQDGSCLILFRHERAPSQITASRSGREQDQETAWRAVFPTTATALNRAILSGQVFL